MKNKKFKLFASLTSLVMVVAVMAVGVWAASGASITTTAKVTFTASGFTATEFTATLSGADTSAATNATYTNSKAIGAGQEIALDDWTIGTISFTDETTAIEFTFTLSGITVPAGYKLVPTVTMEDATNITKVISNGDTVSASESAAVTGQSITSTVTLNIADVGQKVDANISITVDYDLQTLGA